MLSRAFKQPVRSLSYTLSRTGGGGGWKSRVPGWDKENNIYPDEKTGEIPFDKFNHTFQESGKRWGPVDRPENLKPWYNDMTRDHEITKEPEYEEEVRKQYEKLNYRISYGWEHNNPGKDYFLMNDLWWKVLGVFAIFVPIYMNYLPDVLGKNETWYKREAIIRIEEALKEGRPIIDPNWCPLDKMKDHVPPAGQWEEEYLSHQVTTYPNCHRDHMLQSTLLWDGYNK